MKRLGNNSISEYTDYTRYICTIVLTLFGLGCEAFFVFAAAQQKTPERIAVLTISAIVFGIALAAFAYENFTHYPVKTVINSSGLYSIRFGKELKGLNWDDIKDVVCAEVGFTAGVRERYLAFAEHKLSNREKKCPVLLAGNYNDVIVVRYTEELVNAIREFHEIEIDFGK